jgi:hypothetical protein
MKTYNGMYLGICINNNDPKKRGRVQVFVPHIMPALEEGWNKQGVDINISCVGENMVDGLTSDMINKLSFVLPWAEAASPIIGASAPGTLNTTDTGDGKSIAGSHYNQSPVPDPKINGTIAPYLDKVREFAGTDERAEEVKASIGTTQGEGNCARGVGAQFGADGIQQFANIGSGGVGFNARDVAFGGGKEHLITNTGLYEAPVKLGNKLTDFKSSYTPQDGDVIATSGGGTQRDGQKYGHIQRYIDPPGKWISDFAQEDILSRPNVNSSDEDYYSNFTLFRPNDAGKAKFGSVRAATVGVKAQPNPEYTSVSGELSDQNVQKTPSSVNQDSTSPFYGSGADPNVSLDSTATPKRKYSPNELKFAMMIGAAESGAGISDPNYVKKQITDIDQRVGYAWGYGKGMSDNELRQKGKEIQQAGSSAITKGGKNKPFNWAEVDLGYMQSNEINNLKGAKNSGTYTEQVEGTAEIIRNLSEGNSKYGPQVKESIDSGDFSRAKEILGSHDKSVTIGTKYFGLTDHKDSVDKMQALIEDPDGKYKGDVEAAMKDIDRSLGEPLPTLAQLTNGQYKPDTNLVATLDSHGTMSSINLNNMAKGLFTYPAAGAMLWTFFREGNPLFPVYFAASYSQAEWKSAYRYGSDGPSYKPAATKDNPVISNGGIWNTGVGGIAFKCQTDSTNFLNNEKSITLFGEDGSKLAMNTGCCDFVSKFDRRDHVEGDRFVRTLGYKEEWIQGSMNKVVMGNYTEKIGNCSQAAVDAVEKIQKLLLEIHEPLTKTQKAT